MNKPEKSLFLGSGIRKDPESGKWTVDHTFMDAFYIKTFDIEEEARTHMEEFQPDDIPTILNLVKLRQKCNEGKK